MSNPRIFRYFKTSPEIIRLAVMMYVRYPPSLRNVEDLLHERGIDKSPRRCCAIVGGDANRERSALLHLLEVPAGSGWR
jgi:putative transposase